MNIYTKPSIRLLATGTNSSSIVSCFSDAEWQDILNIWGITADQAFGPDEGCAFEVEGYCKFASVQNSNNKQAFTS